jgi:hypothetical protein
VHSAAFADRMTALLSSAPAVTGVVMGEGFAGKIPELMTMYQTGSGVWLWRAPADAAWLRAGAQERWASG